MGKSINVYINVVDKRINPPKGRQPDAGVLTTILPEERKMLITVLPSKEEVPSLSEKIADVIGLTGIKPDYYLRTDFKAMEDVIDAIRGIEMTTDKNYKIGDIVYKKGVNNMTGHPAMALFKKTCATEEEMLKIREQVIEGLVRKAMKGFSITYDIPKLYGLKRNIETNIHLSDIKSMAKKYSSGGNSWHIVKQYMLEKDTKDVRDNILEKIKLFNMEF